MNCKVPRPYASRRMFCFPWAGGTPSWFTGLSQDITEDLEVFGFCLKGREYRYDQEPYTCLKEIVDEIVQIIHDNYWDKPFVFYAHSMGSLVSFFTALELKKRYNREPECMILSGAMSPNAPDILNRRPRPRDFPTLNDLKKYTEELGGVPPALDEHPELWDIFLPTFMADLHLVEEMIYELPEGVPPPLTCPIDFFNGTTDFQCNNQEMIEDWRNLTSGTFNYRQMNGGHFYLMEPENTKKLVSFINMKFSLDL